MIFLAAVSPPVQHTLWDIIQQAASFLVSLAVLAGAAYPVVRWVQKRRAKERAEREAARRADLAEQVAEIVAPLREKVDQIHRTTHINHHSSEEPTMLDRIDDVRKQVETCTKALGAVAVNQANLSNRMDRAQEQGRDYVRLAKAAMEDHGIELPEYPDVE